MTTAYIGHDGITAAVEGYALAPRTEGGHFLWYLSMVGSAREGLRSIWAGLLANPPKRTTIMLPATPQHGIIHSAVWAAARHECDGWQTAQPLRLPKSAAYQMVMLPRIALLDHQHQPPSPSPQPAQPNATPAQPQQSPTQTPTDTALTPPLPPPAAPFVLLDTSDRAALGLSLPAYFGARLGRAMDIPLLPDWAEWAWQTCNDRGWIASLLCGGSIEAAYLCRIDCEAFGYALGDAIRRGIIGGRVNVGQSSLTVAPRQPHSLPQTDVQKAA